MIGVWKYLSTRFLRYWRARADILEVAVWVAVFMVLCPAVLLYSGYASWAYVIVVPTLAVLTVRIVRQFTHW